MDEEIIKGKVKDLEGRAQEALGALIDNPKDKAEGKAKQVEGRLRESAGHLRDAARNAADSTRPANS